MNRDSQRTLLVACLPVLRAYVRRIAHDRNTAAELLQEVSVRILAGEGPSDRERFLAWCCGIARHVLARSWRAGKRTRAELPLADDGVAEISAPDFEPESRIDARAWLARAIVRIDRDGLDLLVRRYVFEETGSELSDDLAQSSAAVRMRLMRLRAVLSSDDRRTEGQGGTVGGRPPVTPPRVGPRERGCA
jgi:RNA polymerase sigma factor (sigma-70 family)